MERYFLIKNPENNRVYGRGEVLEANGDKITLVGDFSLPRGKSWKDAQLYSTPKIKGKATKIGLVTKLAGGRNSPNGPVKIFEIQQR